MSDDRETFRFLHRVEIDILERARVTRDYDPYPHDSPHSFAYEKLKAAGYMIRGFTTPDGERYLERLKHPKRRWLKENWFPVAVLVLGLLGPIISGMVLYGLERLLP